MEINPIISVRNLFLYQIPVFTKLNRDVEFIPLSSAVGGMAG